MELLFFAGLFVLFFWIIYQDILHRKDLEKKDKMLEDLTLKFMAKDVDDYIKVKQPEPENMEGEEDPYVDADEIPPQVGIEAKDRVEKI